MSEPNADRTLPQIDWETFYADYRRPGFIAGYDILQKLGQGAFGIVFKARKTSIGKDYAIKFLKVDDVAVRDAVLHELSTVKLFAQVDHPNLVSIEDMGQTHGIPYIVMGYAGDETLAKRLAAGRLARDEAIRWFVQVCRGVEALHHHMLVHFDLKPANVYIKGEVARVGDYGLSKMVTASRRSLSFGRGTTYYMAPEVLHRKGDHRSDIYSLGIMLYECLVGRVPFQGETEWEILKKHESEQPQYPADLLPQDRALLEFCLRKDPDSRPQSVGELLEHCQGGSPVTPPAARPSSKSKLPPPKADPRTRRRLSLVTAVALVVGLGFALRIARSPQGRNPSGDGRSIAIQSGPPPQPSATATLVSPSPPQNPQSPAQAADQGAEFRSRLDEAITALQRLRDIDLAQPSLRDKAVTALGRTLGKIQPDELRGQELLTETLVQAIKAGRDNPEVRSAWGDLFRTLLPGAEAPQASQSPPPARAPRR